MHKKRVWKNFRGSRKLPAQAHEKCAMKMKETKKETKKQRNKKKKRRACKMLLMEGSTI